MRRTRFLRFLLFAPVLLAFVTISGAPARSVAAHAASVKSFSCSTAPAIAPDASIGSTRSVNANLDGYSARVLETVEHTPIVGYSRILVPTSIRLYRGGDVLESSPILAPVDYDSGEIYLGTDPSANRPATPSANLCLANFKDSDGPVAVLAVQLINPDSSKQDYVLEAFPTISPPPITLDLGSPIDLGAANGSSFAVIVTADMQFAGAFAPSCCELAPVEALEVSIAPTHRLISVTRSYPAYLARDAAETWSTYVDFTSQSGSVPPLAESGALAAWAADECGLNHCTYAFSRITGLATNGSLHFPGAGYPENVASFLKKLRLLLAVEGYDPGG